MINTNIHILMSLHQQTIWQITAKILMDVVIGCRLLRTSGKESAEMLDKYDFKHLYVCSPQFSTTIYMNHNEINIDKFWVFKNGVPVYNETSGFQQIKLIYSEGHFKCTLCSKYKRNVCSPIYLPHKPMDTCNFFEVEMNLRFRVA